MKREKLGKIGEKMRENWVDTNVHYYVRKGDYFLLYPRHVRVLRSVIFSQGRFGRPFFFSDVWGGRAAFVWTADLIGDQK
jgi:hypothetical protein